jgi:hypothetical protein
MRPLSSLVGVGALAVLACAACSSGGSCSNAAFSGTWTGPVSYTATTSVSPTGLAGSSSLNIETSDVSCTDENDQQTETLVFTFAPNCVAKGRRTSNHTVTRCRWEGRYQHCYQVFVDGTADVGDDVVPTQCTLPLDNGGNMNFTIQNGIAHVTASGAFDVVLSGPLTNWDGNTQPQDAYVTVHLSSQR